MSTQPQNDAGAATPSPLTKREARALTERLFVTTNAPEVEGADEMFVVYNEAGGRYTVDLRTTSCQCRDHQYRCASVEGMHCKHVHRVLFRTGAKQVPEWIDRSRVDPVLSDRLEDNATADQEGNSL